MFLEVKNLNVGYGDVQVLWDLNLKIDEGRIVSLVGSNGAGKTTLLRTLSGLLNPYNGKIIFNGKDITNLSTKEIVNMGIVHVPEGRRLFSDMNVEENLLMGAFRRQDSDEIKKDMEKIYELFPILKERKKQKAGSLSGGEQQMLALARGLMGKPKVLLIDEMSLGLAPVVVDLLVDIVKEINAQGTTIFMVEQDVRLALDNSHYGYVLATGRIVMEGASKDLIQNKDIKEAFLGI
ncbi:MAG: ABC transporter ATP-binding protein [Deltaproteobacteria bacterium]|nr:ABC transporter ATP-binding protein [Deltaproteobacteria bacterium]